jgi:hypothetical protein
MEECTAQVLATVVGVELAALVDVIAAAAAAAAAVPVAVAVPVAAVGSNSDLR